MFRKYPKIEHILIIGKPGTYKDITAVKFCQDSFIFDGSSIYSNLTLGFKHILVSKYKDLEDLKGDNWKPGIVFLHDIGFYFHSRDFKNRNLEQIDARKSLINNYRKRGLQILGTLHREKEIDIEIRLIIDWFIYPSVFNVGDENNMEDDIILLEWFDEPDAYEDGKKPKIKTFYDKPDRYARLFNTLEEVKI